MDAPAMYLVGIGGAFGALARHYVGLLVDREDFPVSTLVVNVTGSFVLGLLTFANANQTWLLLLGTGACGAFTTFSSFAYETVRLVDNDRLRAAFGNAIINLTGAFGAVAAAWLLAPI